MSRDRRRWWAAWCGLSWVVTVGSLGWSVAAAAGGEQIPEMLGDAQLADVCFVDAEMGWAVGDRGVVWSTHDGGAHWVRQRLEVTCRLEAVFFLDRDRGWIVGGQALPYTGRTVGVVLTTQDGGRQWSQLKNPTLPWLKQVQFLDAARGWAVGLPSPMYPAGIFRTDDGGRSWTPVPADRLGNWLGAGFVDSRCGVVAGSDGRLMVVACPEIRPAQTPSLPGGAIHGLCLAPGQPGWLVGDAGLVWQTGDGGRSWHVPVGPLPPGLAPGCDFHDVAVFGQDVWIAGAPGSVVVHSGDRGATWEILSTGQHVPLHGLAFVDRQRGWAVGDLGTILATRDGGRHWEVQRAGGRRVAMLGIFSDSEQIPLELIAACGGDDGYLVFTELVGRRDLELPNSGGPPLQDIGHGAVTAVGGVGAEQWWQFPLRQPGLGDSQSVVLATWNRVTGGRAVDRLGDRLVLKIRQWRPDVVVMDSSSPRGDRPVSQLLDQLVLAAVLRAADPTELPNQLTVLGLEPWSVSKVVCGVERADRAAIAVATSQLATRLGCAIADCAARGQALISTEYHPIPLNLGYDVVWSKLPTMTGRQEVFSGIHVPAAGDARRPVGPPLGDLQSLTRAAQRRRNVQQLLDRTAGIASSSAAWLGQLDELTRGLPAQASGELLYQLAQSYFEAGQWELAATTWEQLVQRQPDHPLTDSALTRLIQHYASGEVAWQLQRQTRVQTQVIRSWPDAESVRLAQHAQPVAGLPVGPVAGKESNPVPVVPVGDQKWAECAGRGLAWGRTIQKTCPALFAEPQLQFPLAAACRAQGLTQDAQRMAHRLAALPGQPAWAACAQAELWLVHGRGPAPKPTYECHTATSRPLLDGRLDDDVWQQAAVMELQSPHHDDELWPAAVQLAWDDQFLFLAASFRKFAGREYAPPHTPRPRDGDLREYDRIELRLDINRDYATCYRLAIDERGWTNEACAGSRTWDPPWYVAAAQTDTQWTVEAAIELRELGPPPARATAVWALGVQRILPGVGLQSFSPPASVRARPEGWALLVFR